MPTQLPESALDSRTRWRLLAVLVTLALALLGGYLVLRAGVLAADGRYRPADAVFAVALLLAELFLALHAVGFLLSIAKAARAAAYSPDPLLLPVTFPEVAVLVCGYNEPEEVLDETLAAAAALDWPALSLILVDDSTLPERRAGAEAVAARYGARLARRESRAGYKAGAINDLLPSLRARYIAILDSDQRPLPCWLRETVPHLEADPGLAFVQAPQIYDNDEGLPVAAATKAQQAMFFEYICEGKSTSNAMFCCGSNVVMRREALLSIETIVDGRRHFFDETSVTEDFATSIRLHRHGFRTLYLNRSYVRGMGPETLEAYFTQQMRWAMGTMRSGLELIASFPRMRRSLTPAQWWEYSLSGTYYFIGFANLVFLLAPPAFALAGIRPVRSHSLDYLAVFAPYLVSTLVLLFFGMRLRGWPFKIVWLASALSFSTVRTYVAAALVALLGLRRAFGVTPKGVGGSLPWTSLWPEMVLLGLNLATTAIGLAHLAREGLTPAWGINTVWAAYHSILLSTLFLHFNRPVAPAPAERLFRPLPLPAAIHDR